MSKTVTLDCAVGAILVRATVYPCKDNSRSFSVVYNLRVRGVWKLQWRVEFIRGFVGRSRHGIHQAVSMHPADKRMHERVLRLALAWYASGVTPLRIKR